MTENHDLYKILQVHPEAEHEVIKSAYKKLCQKYHPDVNKSSFAHSKIRLINLAYEILGDEIKRAEYHKKWLFENRQSVRYVDYKKQQRESIQKEQDQAAIDVLNSYFVHISLNQFKQAYECISEQDKGNISFEDFLRWQKAVSNLFQVGCVEINIFRRFENVKLEDKKYDNVLECSVNISEKNLKTNIYSKESINKYMVYDNNQWKVFHGYGYIKPLIDRFEILANAKAYSTAMEHWANMQMCIDHQTGLPNKQGLMDKIQPEISRTNRYGKAFSMIYVEIYRVSSREEKNIKFEPAQEEFTKLKAMYTITKNLRVLDFFGVWEDTSFLVVLPETALNGAKTAGEKLLNALLLNENLEEIGASAGICTFKPNGDCEKLIHDAKNAARVGRISNRKKAVVSPISQ